MIIIGGGVGYSIRLAKIFQPGLPWTKPSSPGLPAQVAVVDTKDIAGQSAQVAGSSGTFLALNTADNMNEYC